MSEPIKDKDSQKQLDDALPKSKYWSSPVEKVQEGNVSGSAKTKPRKKKIRGKKDDPAQSPGLSKANRKERRKVQQDRLKAAKQKALKNEWSNCNFILEDLHFTVRQSRFLL